jgi:hypothetical protein
MQQRDGPRDNVLRFPPKIAERSLERKLAIRRQSTVATEWIDYFIALDRSMIAKAKECGWTEEHFRPFAIAALKREGRL